MYTHNAMAQAAHRVRLRVRPRSKERGEPADGVFANAALTLAMEALFPSGAFAGPDAEENARNTSKARCIMFFFYLAFLVFFAYQT